MTAAQVEPVEGHQGDQLVVRGVSVTPLERRLPVIIADLLQPASRIETVLRPGKTAAAQGASSWAFCFCRRNLADAPRTRAQDDRFRRGCGCSMGAGDAGLCSCEP